MSDFDEELLALAEDDEAPRRSTKTGGGRKRLATGSSRANKRRRRRSDDDDDDEEEEEEDDEDEDEDEEEEEEDSDMDTDDDDEEEEEVEPNPYPWRSLYKDAEEEQKLLDLPEIEREQILATRRDEISKRQQRIQLAAMVRQQREASGPKRKSSDKKASKAKAKKSAAKAKPKAKPKSRLRRESDLIGSEGEEAEDDEEEEEEEDDGSDFESSRRTGGRTRKPVGASQTKSAKLERLKKKRAIKAGKANEDSLSESEESDWGDEPSRGAAALTLKSRAQRERESRQRVSKEQAEKGIPGRGGREKERKANKGPWTPPDLEDLNRALLMRDTVAKMLHKPGWKQALIGKFIRIQTGQTRIDENTGRRETHYRIHEVESIVDEEQPYYDMGEGRYTNVHVHFLFGTKVQGPVPLNFISNSPISEAEVKSYRLVIASTDSKKPRGPSKEAVQDEGDALEDFLNEPFTDDLVRDMVKSKKEARAKFEEQERTGGAGAFGRARRDPYSNSGPPSVNGGATPAGTAIGTPTRTLDPKAAAMAEMNERARKADRERIIEAERRASLWKRKQDAIDRAAAADKARAATGESQESTNGATNGAAAVATGAPAKEKDTAKPLTSTIESMPLEDALDVDLGDF